MFRKKFWPSWNLSPLAQGKQLSTRRKPHALDQSPFYKLRSRRKLARLLFLSVGRLEKIANDQSTYTEWDEHDPVRRKTRHIENPRADLKRIQGRISSLLLSIEPPGFLFCPARRRSFVANAKAHLGAATVFTIDIRKFFQSARATRVRQFFQNRMWCSPDVAAVLTKLSTFRGHLPTGSPLSPIVSFYSYWGLWIKIAQLAAAEGCTISVYMDDLTVSGARIPGRLIWEIKKQIHQAGLGYHKEKLYQGKFAAVTGLILQSNRLRLPNAKLKKAYQLRRNLLVATDERVRAALRKKLAGLRSLQHQIDAANRE